MKFKILCIPPHEWAALSTVAHRANFGVEREKEMDTHLSYALLMVEPDQDVPLGYVTCQLQDPATVRWRFGAVMPPHRGSFHVLTGYRKLIDWERAQPGRERIITWIGNKNTRMLRLAMTVGFEVIGTRTYKGHILLDHCLELK